MWGSSVADPLPLLQQLVALGAEVLGQVHLVEVLGQRADAVGCDHDQAVVGVDQERDQPVRVAGRAGSSARPGSISPSSPVSFFMPHHVEHALLDRGVGRLELDLVHVGLALRRTRSAPATWSKCVWVRITFVVVRLDAALAQRGGTGAPCIITPGVDDVVLAGADQAAVGIAIIPATFPSRLQPLVGVEALRGGARPAAARRARPRARTRSAGREAGSRRSGPRRRKTSCQNDRGRLAAPRSADARFVCC